MCVVVSFFFFRKFSKFCKFWLSKIKKKQRRERKKEENSFFFYFLFSSCGFLFSYWDFFPLANPFASPMSSFVRGGSFLPYLCFVTIHAP